MTCIIIVLVKDNLVHIYRYFIILINTNFHNAVYSLKYKAVYLLRINICMIHNIYRKTKLVNFFAQKQTVFSNFPLLFSFIYHHVFLLKKNNEFKN